MDEQGLPEQELSKEQLKELLDSFSEHNDEVYPAINSILDTLNKATNEGVRLNSNTSLLLSDLLKFDDIVQRYNSTTDISVKADIISQTLSSSSGVIKRVLKYAPKTPLIACVRATVTVGRQY